MSETGIRDAASAAQRSSETETQAEPTVGEAQPESTNGNDKASIDRAVRPLIDRYRVRRPDADVALIERAYVVARDAHRDQVRRSVPIGRLTPRI